MGVSQNSIAFSCGCAQSTVSDVLRAARAHQLSWPLPEEMDDAAIRLAIYPEASRKAQDKADIDHERISAELCRRGMTMSLLWNEYSNYLYAEGFYRTDEEAWVSAHVHMFSFFGGSTPIPVPDNCKTAITRNAKEALIVNEQ